MKLIDKDALVAEIENLLDKGRYNEEYDCAYRDGNNNALYALKNKLNTLEVKEVDSKLTLEDIEIILGIENNILHECNDNGQLVIEAYPKGEDYYGEILRRFNNQRIKSQRMISAEAKEAMYDKPSDEYESLTDFGKQMKE